MKIQIQTQDWFEDKNTPFITQVGDFGWGPGFPSDDQEHRCAFHYYGDYHLSFANLLK